MHTTRSFLSLSAAAALLLGGGVAANAHAEDAAAPAAADATTVTVTVAPSLKAGDRSPFDVAGVKQIRRGKTIPSGYALVGKTIATSGSGPSAGAYLHYICPAGKTMRSFAVIGKAGFRAESRSYVGRRTAFVASVYPGGTGSVYAVCR